MSDIILSNAVRENLLSLQNTSNLMSTVQNRLATGLDVNSALDDPNAYFTASALNNRAADLNRLLDDMGQGVQTLKSADDGLTSITDLVDSAKALASQALQTDSQYERRNYAKQYNNLLEQIEDIAKDASYKGKNLLGGIGNDLRVIFNEENTSKIDIFSIDYTDTTLEDGLNLQRLEEGSAASTAFTLTGGTATFSLENSLGDNVTPNTPLSDITNITFPDPTYVDGNAFTVTPGVTTVSDFTDFIDGLPGVSGEYNVETGSMKVVSTNDLVISSDAGGATPIQDTTPADIANYTVAPLTETSNLVTSGRFTLEDVITFEDGNEFELGEIEITADTTVADLVLDLNDIQGVEASFNATTGTITTTSDVDLRIFSTDTTDFPDVSVNAVDAGFAEDSLISNIIDRINVTLDVIRTQASEFGTNLSTVEIRQDFTQSLIVTLETGAGQLTIADMNEEGANMLALQTRQQLSSTALSLANQSDQTVLSLFG
ncbi:MAG: flagellin [Stappiaceae bacterium]